MSVRLFLIGASELIGIVMASLALRI